MIFGAENHQIAQQNLYDLTHTSLNLVEGIMTMIRAIKTDHYLDPKCSPLLIHVLLDIRYMTNYINFRCYLGVLGDIHYRF